MSIWALFILLIIGLGLWQRHVSTKRIREMVMAQRRKAAALTPADMESLRQSQIIIEALGLKFEPIICKEEKS